MPQEKTLRLILGDQLNEKHSWFRSRSQSITYCLMEVRQETDYVEHHIQKVVGFFASMRRFAERLQKKGHHVVYLPLDDRENAHSFEDNIKRLLKRGRYTRFEYLLPDEYRLDLQFREFCENLPVVSTATDTEHFLTKRHELKEFFAGKKRLLMESFYRHMRKKYNILLDEGEPAGGRWNYDQSNRNRYDGKAPVPAPKVFNNNVTEIHDLIDRMGVKTFGEINPEKFIWPVTRQQALSLLREFLNNRLPFFGTYQDAMTSKYWALFHSRLSFALNTKMLHPMEIIERAVLRAAENKGLPVGIAQLEGFVRQILGWREYMRGVYWSYMPGYERMNYFNHSRALPRFYWTGRTRMHCISKAVGQSLKYAYAHHIQRLMVTGNFALLAGIHPDHIDAWYLGIYIDAVQWVEMVNTRGMSQFADGGIVATKPYISSANYIRKMSDYCDQCHYAHAKKTGDRACPFNSLYWDFLNRHRKKLGSNPRISMVYRTWDRMKETTRRDLLDQAKQYMQMIDQL